MSAPVLSLSHLTAGYGETTVLRDVNFDVPAGKVVALLGPNGAGKTTLLKTATGLIRPSAGQVIIDGVDVTNTPANHRARDGLCLIPEGRGVFPNLSVRENIRMYEPDRSKSARNAALDRAVTAFPQLRDKLDVAAGDLSGGQQQMLALTRSYLSNPKLILLDEVSMGLAPLVIDEIFAYLDRLAASGATLLLVEQYVHRALAMADIVLLLSQGQVVYEGGPSGLDEHQVLERYLGVDLYPDGVDSTGQ